jgi:transcriptional regulator with XRE-family HTH domain
MEFSGMLKKFREEKGWTQAELAKRSGVSLRTIQGWEQGHRAPVSPDFFRVVKVLGVSADRFAESDLLKKRVAKKRKGK